MKKNIKLVIAFIIGMIITAGISVYATIQYQADEIGYGNGTIKDAIDDLYSKVGTGSSDLKFCELKSGTALTVGSKYECDPGDGTKRNFYVLTVNNSNNSVELIMEYNITDTLGSKRTMSWNEAMGFIEKNSLRTAWNNVIDVDLPRAQAIANAVGNSSWIAANSSATWWCFGSGEQDSQSEPYCNNANLANYLFLYNHLSGCAQTGCTSDSNATGYWTKDMIDSTFAWGVEAHGDLDYPRATDATVDGVRLVITVLKSNLYE